MQSLIDQGDLGQLKLDVSAVYVKPSKVCVY